MFPLGQKSRFFQRDFSEFSHFGSHLVFRSSDRDGFFRKCSRLYPSFLVGATGWPNPRCPFLPTTLIPRPPTPRFHQGRRQSIAVWTRSHSQCAVVAIGTQAQPPAPPFWRKYLAALVHCVLPKSPAGALDRTWEFGHHENAMGPTFNGRWGGGEGILWGGSR